MPFAFLRFLVPLTTVCVPSIVRDPFDTLRYTLQIMSSVAVVGTGYVGLTTAVCLADLGREVIGFDIDTAKVARLVAGVPPIYELVLTEVMREASLGGEHSSASDDVVALT